MPQTLGESTETWANDVLRQAEEFANNIQDVKPFYIVYACKMDKPNSQKMGTAVFKQAFKAYYTRPAQMLGILVWYVNRPLGEFRFCPELSAPPDVPVDPSLLSKKAEDASPALMEKGRELNVLVS